jgi:hypothetical protein
VRWFRPSRHRFREAVPAFLEGLQSGYGAGAAVRYTTVERLDIAAVVQQARHCSLDDRVGPIPA